MSPDAKYYHRSELGNTKYNLGSDNEDISTKLNLVALKTKSLPCRLSVLAISRSTRTATRVSLSSRRLNHEDESRQKQT